MTNKEFRIALIELNLNCKQFAELVGIGHDYAVKMHCGRYPISKRIENEIKKLKEAR